MRLVLAAAAAMLTVALLAGCAAAGGGTVTVSGKTLTIYISQPPGAAALEPANRDVIDAEQLAFRQHQADVSAFKVALAPTLNNAKLSANARTAISDTSAIAYVGEIRPGDSADSIGITNAEDLLQVSPTDTALELTQASGAVPRSPGRYYESLKAYGRTFARVVPTSGLEAKAQVQEMQSVGVKRLYVTDDGSPYGKALALALRNDAPAAGITALSSASGADAAFLAGSSASTFARVAQANPSLKLFAPSALDNTASVSALGVSGPTQLYVSSPGFLPRELTASGQKFVTDFKATYGHAPASEAIFGYEAMAAVLHVLQQTGAQASNRSTVVKNFLSLHGQAFVVPTTYSINSTTGDTSLASFVFSRLRGGALVPFKSVTASG